MSHAHPYTFDPRFTPFSMPSVTLDDTPPYTPRSKSLDLLRCSNDPCSSAVTSAATPCFSGVGTAHNSLDTISTLKGQRISSPIFLNSSVGVKPLPEEPTSHTVQRNEDEEECSLFDAPPSPTPAVSVMENGSGQPRASTLSSRSYLFTDHKTGQLQLQPKTPSRHHESSSEHFLRSKFSMSPVQVSKRSKARTSQDQSLRLPDGALPQDPVARSTFGNWSHSLGVAARKLQLPRKASDESYKSAKTLSTVLDQSQESSRKEQEMVATPESKEKDKGNSLRNAASLASIRRFITPSRRTRKVSSTSRGLSATTGKGRAMLAPDDVIAEQGGMASSNEEGGDPGWMDADGRDSQDLLTRAQPTNTEDRDSPLGSSVYLMVPTLSRSMTRRGMDVPEGERAVVGRRPTLLSPEFYEPPSNPSPSLEHSQTPIATATGVTKDDENISDAILTSRPVETAKTLLSAEEASPAAAPTSKLKTLQLLARRPFNAFGKKMRETQKSWFSSSSRISADLPALEQQQQGVPTRRSEDLLSKASPRIFDASTLAQKSRSVELDRLGLPSKVVPLRSAAVTGPNGAGYKKRPTIPAAFAKAVPPQSQTGPRPVRAVDGRATVSASPRISDSRHPWMKQLQLPSTTIGGEGTQRQMWPSVNDASPPSVSVNIVPTLSLTAASLTLSQSALDNPLVPKKQSPRRPPASLLGQSLPIPPRSGRSRASTISSQSSATSSPSGKVIVSRRSYGQRLRSPGTREETGSIRSVGTSILFTESPPSSPGMRKFMSPYHAARSPSTIRIRSPPTTVLLPKYSPRRAAAAGNSVLLPTLHRKPSSAFSDDDSETEWMDDDNTAELNTSTTALNDLMVLRSRLEEVLPPIRPGFLEMNEATQTLSNLVKTFSNSSGSLSLHSSPYKKDTPTQQNRAATAATTATTATTSGKAAGRGLYGIMEADEPSASSSFSLSYTLSRSPPASCHLASPPGKQQRQRERLISKVSIISTEANSSFEDSEELQKLLDSIMAADLGGSTSCDTSGETDMALLSPFGSPADYRDSMRSEGKRLPRQEVKREGGDQEQEQGTRQRVEVMPPPPKFLLNDRPISPPDSSCLSHGCDAEADREGEAEEGCEERFDMVPTRRDSTLSMVPSHTAAVNTMWRETSGRRKTRAESSHGSGALEDSGYASFSVLDSYHSSRFGQ